MYKIFDKHENRVVANAEYEFFYEANHMVINMNWDTGNWGCGNERYEVQETSPKIKN